MKFISQTSVALALATLGACGGLDDDSSSPGEPAEESVASVELTEATISKEGDELVVRGLTNGEATRIVVDEVQLEQQSGITTLLPSDAARLGQKRARVRCSCAGYSTTDGNQGAGMACVCW